MGCLGCFSGQPSAMKKRGNGGVIHSRCSCTPHALHGAEERGGGGLTYMPQRGGLVVGGVEGGGVGALRDGVLVNILRLEPLQVPAITDAEVGWGACIDCRAGTPNPVAQDLPLQIREGMR